MEYSITDRFVIFIRDYRRFRTQKSVYCRNEATLSTVSELLRYQPLGSRPRGNHVDVSDRLVMMSVARPRSQ